MPRNALYGKVDSRNQTGSPDTAHRNCQELCLHLSSEIKILIVSGLIVCLPRSRLVCHRQIKVDSGRKSVSCGLRKAGRKKNLLNALAYTQPTSAALNAANEISASITS